MSILIALAVGVGAVGLVSVLKKKGVLSSSSTYSPESNSTAPANPTPSQADQPGFFEELFQPDPDDMDARPNLKPDKCYQCSFGYPPLNCFAVARLINNMRPAEGRSLQSYETEARSLVQRLRQKFPLNYKKRDELWKEYCFNLWQAGLYTGCLPKSKAICRVKMSDAPNKENSGTCIPSNFFPSPYGFIKNFTKIPPGETRQGIIDTYTEKWNLVNKYTKEKKTKKAAEAKAEAMKYVARFCPAYYNGCGES